MVAPIQTSTLPPNYYDLADAEQQLEIAFKNLDAHPDFKADPKEDRATYVQAAQDAEDRLSRAALYQSVQTGKDLISQSKTDMHKIDTTGYVGYADAALGKAHSELQFLQRATKNNTSEQQSFLQNLDAGKWTAFDTSLSEGRNFYNQGDWSKAPQTSYDNGSHSLNGYLVTSGDEKGRSMRSASSFPGTDPSSSNFVRLNWNYDKNGNAHCYFSGTFWDRSTGKDLVNKDGTINMDVLQKNPDLNNEIPAIKAAIEQLKPKMKPTADMVNKYYSDCKNYDKYGLGGLNPLAPEPEYPDTPYVHISQDQTIKGRLDALAADGITLPAPDLTRHSL